MSSDKGSSPSAFRVIVAGIVWRLFGADSAGTMLLQAMTSDDEQNRMLAGMSLVKAGDRSLRLIEDGINEEKGSVPLIQLLPDIGGEDARELLEAMAASESNEVAAAATECIDLLDRMKSL